MFGKLVMENEVIKGNKVTFSHERAFNKYFEATG